MDQSELVQFNILLGDAKANFDTARYPDAARGFEYLAHLCAKHNKVVDSVYFAYRTAISWKMADKIDELIKLYKSLSMFFMQHSEKLCEEIIKDDLEIDRRIKVLETYQSVLAFQNKSRKRETTLLELIRLYQDRARLEPLREDVFLDKAIKHSIEMGDRDKTMYLVRELAGFYVNKSEKILSSDSADYMEITVKILEKARSLFMSINDTDNITYIDDKIAKLNII